MRSAHLSKKDTLKRHPRQFLACRKKHLLVEFLCRRCNLLLLCPYHRLHFSIRALWVHLTNVATFFSTRCPKLTLPPAFLEVIHRHPDTNGARVFDAFFLCVYTFSECCYWLFFSLSFFITSIVPVSTRCPIFSRFRFF